MRAEPVQVTGVEDALSVVVFGSSACAVIGDGTVSCWGPDPNSDNPRSTPETVPGLTGVTDLAASASHACALRENGEVRCWGRNQDGQLGDGTTTDRTEPVTVDGVGSATAIAVSLDHSCAILADRSVRCWGRGNQGQLGDGGTSASSVPVTAQGVTTATSIAASGSTTCVTRSTLDVLCWGDGFGAGTVVPGYDDAVKVVMGPGGGCVVQAAGTIRCAGSNPYGALGNGTLETPAGYAPVTVSGISDAVDVRVGLLSTYAVHADGDVSCWGFGIYGELGGGRFGFSIEPVPVPGTGGATSLAGADSGFCAAVAGTVRCWGRNHYQRFGSDVADEAWSPVTVDDLGGAEGLTMDYDGVCGVRSGGVVCVGESVAAPLTSGVENVTFGREYFGCARKSDDNIWCWGQNSYGQLGDGTTDASTGTQVSGVSGAAQVVAGEYYACARLHSGDVRCWGDGTGGKLGNGDTQSSTVPVAVSGLTDATAIATGRRATCAVRAGGAVVCWGSEEYGQLGNGAASAQTTPEPVTGISDAVGIFGGENIFCLTRQTGAVSCWGRKSVVGLPGVMDPQESFPTPQDVPELAGFTHLSLHLDSGCGIAADTTVRCWGVGDSGQLGDGLMPEGHGPQPLPRKVIGFGGSGSAPDSDPPGDDPAVSEPPGRGDDAEEPASPPRPPFLTPPRPGRVAVPALVLRGRTLTFSNYRVQRRGKSCPRRVIVTVKAGRTAVRRDLPVTRRSGLCLLRSARIVLPKARPSVRVALSGRGVQARSVLVRQTSS